MSFAHLSQPPEPDDQDSGELDPRLFDVDGDPINWSARYKPGDKFHTMNHTFEVASCTQDTLYLKRHAGKSYLTIAMRPWQFKEFYDRQFTQANSSQPRATNPQSQQLPLPDATRTIKRGGES